MPYMKRVLSFISNRTTLNIILLVALAFRIVLIPSPGFEADISFWKSWGLAVKDFGIVKGLPLTNFNYPTPFAYVLAVMAYVYSFFADPHNFNQFWNNTNLTFLAVAKSLPIMADFGIFAVLVWLGKNAKRLNLPTVNVPVSGVKDVTTLFYTVLGLIYLFNPLSLFDGALWGQVDSVGVLLFLLAVCCILSKKPLLGGIVYMVSMMTKLQNMIYGPIFFLFTWQYLGFDGLMRAVAGSGGTFILLNFEFIKARSMGRVAGDLTGNYDYFPWLSLNAYNVWWIVSGAKGMDVSDKILSVGMLNAKTVGLFLFSSTYLLSVLTMLKGRFLSFVIPAKEPESSQVSAPKWMPGQARHDNTDDPVVSRELIFRFISALIIACAGFFLFQTESHDRYAFPISIFFLLWAPFLATTITDTAKFTRIIKSLFFHYLFFTVIYFYNMHNAMLDNYPNNGVPFLTFLNVPSLTIVASYLQIGMFFYFLYHMRRYITVPLFTITAGIFIGLLVVGNKPLILKQPVYITKLTPVLSTTGYGQHQKNMPVNAWFGINKWGFLSVQYAFYRYGIGTHAPSREVFDINRRFSTLNTDFGIDTNGGPQGSVVFSVYGDGKLLFASPLKKRFEFPGHVELDIRGIKTLELNIGDGGNGNFDDHADWLNTYLIP